MSLVPLRGVACCVGSQALCEQSGKLINTFSSDSLCGLTPILGVFGCWKLSNFQQREITWITQQREKQLVFPLKSVWLGGGVLKITLCGSLYSSPMECLYECCAGDGLMQWDSWSAGLKSAFLVFSLERESSDNFLLTLSPLFFFFLS